MDGPSAVLVASRADLERAGAWQAAGHSLVAGNYHMCRLLEREGIAATPGSALLTAQDKTAILREVSDFIAVLNAWRGEGAPTELVAILKAALVKAAFVHAQYSRASATLGVPILRAEGASLVLATEPAHPKLRYSSTLAAPELPPLDHAGRSNGTLFDFRSTSGLKLASSLRGTAVRPKATRNSAWLNGLENNLARLFRTRHRDLKFGVRPVVPDRPLPSGPEVDDPGLQEMMDAVVTMHAQLFFDHRNAMRGLLRRSGRPAGAIFNNVGHAALAGFAAAMIEAGVPCEMGSHGCVVRTGEADHDAVAALLGPIVYNSFPGMTFIAPRSPLQARDAGNETTIIKQVRPSVTEVGSPFHILYAPNFQPWDSCFHGFTIDCFDTVRAVSTFARMVAQAPEFTLDIRIKTSAADNAKKGKGALRGVMPDDIAASIEPENGVKDASYGSHSAAMTKAGMVVTEGPTAVVFEALERRIPVILLGNQGVTPLLPGVPLAQAAKEGMRSAVYTAESHEDLAAALRVIALHHENAPLTDDEVRPYIWV